MNKDQERAKYRDLINELAALLKEYKMRSTAATNDALHERVTAALEKAKQS